MTGDITLYEAAYHDMMGGIALHEAAWHDGWHSFI